MDLHADARSANDRVKRNTETQTAFAAEIFILFGCYSMSGRCFPSLCVYECSKNPSWRHRHAGHPVRNKNRITHDLMSKSTTNSASCSRLSFSTSWLVLPVTRPRLTLLDPPHADASSENTYTFRRHLVIRQGPWDPTLLLSLEGCEKGRIRRSDRA